MLNSEGCLLVRISSAITPTIVVREDVPADRALAA